MAKDYYEILGVQRTADENEIRTAYRKLAHKYHPDKTGGDKAAEDKLKEINEAYDTLKNKEKRARYDRFGHDGASFGAGFGSGGAGFGGASPFDDIFEAFFGGGMGRARAGDAPMQGNDLEYRTRITLREAARGVTKHIRFTRLERCSECQGTGAESGTDKEVCSDCGGTGQVRMAQGFFSITRTCMRCQGTGQIVTNPCKRCQGTGAVEQERELSIDIPAGVDSGSRLRVGGEGEPGRNNGPRGDLYVLIEVEKDKLFERSGTDILCEMPISFAQAALGATVVVPTLEGEAELKIPPGTQTGTLFRLRGLGIPDIRGYRHGDEIVKVQVEVPTKLTREQKELIQQFEELSTTKTYPLYQRFVEKIKASFTRD